MANSYTVLTIATRTNILVCDNHIPNTEMQYPRADAVYFSTDGDRLWLSLSCEA